MISIKEIKIIIEKNDDIITVDIIADPGINPIHVIGFLEIAKLQTITGQEVRE